ncbi:helix-turn-helix transcriptional regulator [Jeongeupia sp. USM3]|uniref:helix-turn-helix transcriptional regulator n=1 Tax=Jeongeupia sp. USM3 TaxID=1906741 RepID=UPI000B0A7ABC|nr:AraC family transcriptional regulator [Jeongeupia sp. USM3]
MLAVVVWFRSDWITALAQTFPECAPIARLADAAGRGLAFSREAAAQVRPLLASLHDKTPALRLAALAAMSVGAFHRFFRRHTETTVTAYLARLRIGYACQQLIQTDRAIGVIAEAAGYATLAHFNRQFRAAKGETPRAFRQRYREPRASSS